MCALDYDMPDLIYIIIWEIRETWCFKYHVQKEMAHSSKFESNVKSRKITEDIKFKNLQGKFESYVYCASTEPERTWFVPNVKSLQWKPRPSRPLWTRDIHPISILNDALKMHSIKIEVNSTWPKQIILNKKRTRIRNHFDSTFHAGIWIAKPEVRNILDLDETGRGKIQIRVRYLPRCTSE